MSRTRFLGLGFFPLLFSCAEPALEAPPSYRSGLSMTFEAIADTEVSDRNPSSNYGASTTMTVRRWPTGYDFRSNAIVGFDNADIVTQLSGYEVLTAEVVLTISETSLVGAEYAYVTAHRAVQDWEELGATWTCANGTNACATSDLWDLGQPGNNPYAASGVPGARHFSTIRFDVTDELRALLDGDEVRLSWFFRMRDDQEGQHLRVRSREGASGVPSLRVLAQPLPPPDLPNDPETVAPPLPGTEVASAYSAYSFLFNGPDPIQTDVAPNSIDDARIAVARGRVLLRSGVPAANVEVRIKNHPEWGSTLTREDGVFDLAVNGGGALVLEFERGGLLHLERTVQVPWQSVVTLDDVVMIPRDSSVSVIDFNFAEPIQVVEATPVIDDDGYRRQVLMFRGETEAVMHLPNDTAQPLSVMHVRSTEFTVGDLGPQTMPAMLPDNTAYTYAAEFSIDEAEAANASLVTFDPPAISYTLDFIKDEQGDHAFRPGEPVPAGSYDVASGTWVSENNGIVLRVVEVGQDVGIDISNNLTDDIAAPSALAALGIDADEEEAVLARFPVGSQLWRVETSHFSSWDYNWGLAPPVDADDPPSDGPGPPPEPNACIQSGSIIECENQVLGETIPLAATPFSLHYRSSRTPAAPAFRLRLPITESPLNGKLRRVIVRADLAGRHFEEVRAPVANDFYELHWDGLDVYGRRVQGPVSASVCVGHVYQAEFYSWGAAGIQIPSVARPLRRTSIRLAMPAMVVSSPVQGAGVTRLPCGNASERVRLENL